MRTQSEPCIYKKLAEQAQARGTRCYLCLGADETCSDYSPRGFWVGFTFYGLREREEESLGDNFPVLE